MSAISRGRITTEWIVVLTLIIATCVSVSARKRSFIDGNVNVNVNASGNPQDDIDDFVPYQGERFNRFDWSLLQNMAKNNAGNLLISPISLKLALVLLYEGAQDETASELATVMNLPVGRTATRERFSNILKSLQEKRPEYSLNIGTRIYVDNSILPRQRYAAIATSFYDAEVLNTNFSDTHETAQLINKFVNNVTEGHIPELITNEAGLSENLMLIVNTLFFKGNWHRQPFSVSDTRNDVFHTTNNKTIKVPYMRSSNKFYFVYANDLDAKILRIPYAGNKYSMFIILPQKQGNLDDLVKKISPFTINRHMWLMQEVPVDVKLPKFKFAFTSHLENNLRELGIRDIFDNTATLTGILRSKSTSRRLIVSDIVQKTGIEVNEQGSTAYTATEIEIGTKMNDETFHATQPFLFYIEDESTGTILYMGIVNNPLEETGIAEAELVTPAPMTTKTVEFEPATAAIAAAATVPALGTGFEERYNYFNIELLQTLNEAQPGNVLVGTSSIKAALMILAEAAAGQTRQQILSSLRIPEYTNEIRKAASLTVGEYKDPTGVTELQTAIKLWLGRDVAIYKNYSDILRSYYRGELEAVNFSDVTGTLKAINEWIKKFTHGRINSLTDPSSIASTTKLLLTTSVYFKGKWLNSFDISNSRQRCFNVPNVGCKNITMMETVANFKYAYVYALDSQVVLVPYTGGRMGMLIILPRVPGTQALSGLSKDIAFTPIPSIISTLEDTEVLLQIPRFSINNKINVQDQLAKLKIQDLFSDKANLTTAFPVNNIKVGGFMHNAQIDVNEEGTIAAAVSEAVVVPLIGSTSTVFRADRPFLFFLLDLQTNGILFAGRYFQPDDTAPIAAANTNAKSN